MFKAMFKEKKLMKYPGGKPMNLSFLICTLLSISTAYARADVSLRNGNFYVSFKDISYPGGMEPKIERVYNSKSDYAGIFGYGWGSEYETALGVDPDGSIVVTEFGGGANNRFVSKDFKAQDLDAGVNELVEAGKKAGLVSNAKQISDYRAKLTHDFDYRSKQYNMFVSKGLMAKKALKVGTQYTSTRYLYQYITRVKGGYVRVMEGGNIQKFNEAGKLVQVLDRNKNFITFGYDKNGHLVQMIDNQNRKMNLTYNVQNMVEKIVGESGKYAAYRYDKNRLLDYSRDSDGVQNTFKYTNDRFRNLSEIGYPDEKDSKGAIKKMGIAYYGPDKNISVRAVTNTDGTVNEYDYLKDPKNADYFGVHVLLKEANGTRISDAKYEYFSKTRPGGEAYTSKMISTIDGDKTETVYDDKLGFPTTITNNGRTTKMEYDQKGRMTKKVTAIETTELTYDQTVGKVNKVTRKMKSGTLLWSTFAYDRATGNLLLAKNSEKKSVKLIYDNQGRIRALIDQSGRQLTFKYNDVSKPIEISDAKLGTVKFTYKNSGEVDKLQANGGANVATEIMRALQGLLDITAPSGVTMSI
jgi:YD repeat-containing protein